MYEPHDKIIDYSVGRPADQWFAKARFIGCVKRQGRCDIWYDSTWNWFDWML